MYLYFVYAFVSPVHRNYQYQEKNLISVQVLSACTSLPPHLCPCTHARAQTHTLLQNPPQQLDHLGNMCSRRIAAQSLLKESDQSHGTRILGKSRVRQGEGETQGHVAKVVAFTSQLIALSLDVLHVVLNGSQRP